MGILEEEEEEWGETGYGLSTEPFDDNDLVGSFWTAEEVAGRKWPLTRSPEGNGRQGASFWSPPLFLSYVFFIQFKIIRSVKLLHINAPHIVTLVIINYISENWGFVLKYYINKISFSL